MSETEASAQPAAKVAAPAKQPEQASAPEYARPQGESFTKAILKGAAESAATFAVGAVTPAEVLVKPVKLFKDEQSYQSAQPERIATQEATRPEEKKAAAPIRRPVSRPTGAEARRAETNRQQQLTSVRTQLAKAA